MPLNLSPRKEQVKDQCSDANVTMSNWPRKHPAGCIPTPLSYRASKNGAGKETRTLDSHLGKVVLYQLSYARLVKEGDKKP